MIPLAIPSLHGNEWKYLKECLDTNWVSYAGPFVERFEKELALHTGSREAVAVASGTAALHLALLLAGVGPGEEVVMPGITFVAPANAVRYCGAWPVMIDISPADWQIDVAKLNEFLTTQCTVSGGHLTNRSTGRRIAALLMVHLLGGVGDLDAVAELAAKYELPLIEDAAECLGATYKGRPIGAPLPSLDISRHLVATSFNGNKVITTGGGGALFANDSELAAQARHLSTTAKRDGVTFFHDQVGYNYRMTNIAAALGVAQLEMLEEHVAEKRRIAQHYSAAFDSSEHIVTHRRSPFCDGTFWLYTVLLDRPSLPLVSKLAHMGITTRPVWTPLYKLPAFESIHARCDFADEFHGRALSLPSSVGLQQYQQDRVIGTLLGLLDS